MSQAFLPALTRSRGTIVSNVSLAALAPVPFAPAYSISKAAALSLTQSLRMLLARALPAGLGDIAAGIAAPLVARRLAQGTGRRAALWFNAFGMTDLVVALTLAALTAFQLLNVTPSSAPIAELPLALIPTATVPLFFFLHITAVSVLVRAPQTPLPATVPLTATAE